MTLSMPCSWSHPLDMARQSLAAYHEAQQTPPAPLRRHHRHHCPRPSLPQIPLPIPSDLREIPRRRPLGTNGVLARRLRVARRVRGQGRADGAGDLVCGRVQPALPGAVDQRHPSHHARPPRARLGVFVGRHRRVHGRHRAGGAAGRVVVRPG